jgi:hypothetical protein
MLRKLMPNDLKVSSLSRASIRVRATRYEPRSSASALIAISTFDANRCPSLKDPFLFVAPLEGF